ncbi:MAG: hypothetical protein WC603_01310 [Candidatus Paceibacterota bacterium]|jgi:hypothetical protein
MEKLMVKKLILGAIIFTFAIFFLQIISPLQTSAANQTLNWENPNDGKNPYKFTARSVLNSDMIMQVVGCTNVVDKVSEKIDNFIKDKISINALKNKLRENEKVIAACKAAENVGGTAVGSTPQVTLSPVLLNWIDCKEIQNTKDSTVAKTLEDTAKADEAARKREACFNGIAKRLAKDQLTALTRNTVNWINSGFNGDPMYVRNITSFTNSLERNVLEREINKFTDPDRAYPYGTDFSRSVINSYKTGASFRIGFDNFTDGLVSDLSAFLNITPTYDNVGDYGNTGTYGSGGSYGLETTKTAQQRAQEANDAFANDFTVGGWNGWLALTQRDQNNPLGFTMLASQSLSDQESEKIENTKEELSNNEGFLSQKKCVKWQLYTEDGKPLKQDMCDPGDEECVEDMVIYVYGPDKKTEHDKCVKEETVTPGSLIQDKASTTLGTPERQLELTKDINDVLNSVFSMLLDKLYSQGFSSISSEQYAFGNDNMGIGIGSNDLSDDTELSSSAGFTNGSFDLTRDLGNTYIYNARKSLGSWDAKNNIPGLYPNTAPSGGGANVSYTVTVPGSTKLIDEGFNGWAVGDRAFWNGKEWQNWKKGEANPIKKRGVIQIQKDYVVAAKEILKVLPTVMPKIGELDYCIPGPNPNWDANSGEVDSAFQQYASTLSYMEETGGFLERDSLLYSIARQGDPEYDNYKNIFTWTTPLWWQRITNTPVWIELIRLGNLKPTKKDEISEYNQKQIIYQQEEANRNFENFRKVFGMQMSYLYGRNSPMLKPFLEREDTSILEENTAYLPMAEAGLNITKDILSYDEDIRTSMQDYQNSILQANLNVSKLDVIRKRVNGIIKDAQDRRDAKLLEIIRKEKCDEQYNKCISEIALEATPVKNFSLISTASAANYSTTCDAQYTACMETPITAADKAAYKEKYKECLAEENITYFDENDIMGGTGEPERCFNTLDDDLDGFVDLADTDCSEYIGGNGGGDVGYCNNDVTTSTTNTSTTASCGSINTQSTCNSYIYYHGGFQTSCVWSLDGGGGTGGTSLYGCQVKQGSGHPQIHENNTHCDLRTEEACTLTPYYSNNKEYTCEYLAV